MGSEHCNPNSRRHYDITMSKRTRKQASNLQEAADIQTPITIEEESSPVRSVDEVEEENEQRKSLKELINGGRGRSSLEQHFTEEEKQLQLVRKHHHDQQEGTVEGILKLKGTVSRYVKVLGHLIKIKRDPRVGSKRKPILRLTM